VGIATFTMLVSSTDMNIPTITTSSGSPHLVDASVGGGGVRGAALVGRARVATAVRSYPRFGSLTRFSLGQPVTQWCEHVIYSLENPGRPRRPTSYAYTLVRLKRRYRRGKAY